MTGVLISGVLLAAVWLGGRWLTRYEARAPRVDLGEDRRE